MTDLNVPNMIYYKFGKVLQKIVRIITLSVWWLSSRVKKSLFSNLQPTQGLGKLKMSPTNDKYL